MIGLETGDEHSEKYEDVIRIRIRIRTGEHETVIRFSTHTSDS